MWGIQPRHLSVRKFQAGPKDRNVKSAMFQHLISHGLAWFCMTRIQTLQQGINKTTSEEFVSSTETSVTKAAERPATDLESSGSNQNKSKY